MDQRRLADDVGHPHARVERGVGVLEDHLRAQLRLAARRPSCGRAGRVPLHRIAPVATAAGCRRPCGPSVDLPQPDSPTRPTTSPLRMARSTSSTACTTSSRHLRAEPLGDAAGEVELLREAAGDAAQLDHRRAVAERPAGLDHRVAHAARSASSSSGGSSAPSRPGRVRASRARRMQASAARGQRGAEGAARRQVEQRRRHAGDLAQRLAARVARSAREPIRPMRVGMQRRVQHVGDRAVSRRCARHT